MHMKAQMKLGDYAREREGDLSNIRTAQTVFAHEEQARMEKRVTER
jgi:hypothetical protein